MSLPESIKLTRQKLFMSQETFASEISVSVATINRWENGRSKPNLVAMNSIKNFCLKYKVPFDDIEKDWFNYSVGDKE